MASFEGLNFEMPLEVYLQSAVVRGVLETNQERVSDFLILREGDEVFSLKEASLDLPGRTTPIPGPDQYLIYMREVFLIADLNPRSRTLTSGLESVYVKKDPGKALMSVGPYCLQGVLHIMPGGALHDLLIARTPFIPVTDARLVGYPDLPARTYLVNRSRIGFMTALGDGLVEF